MRGRRKQQLPPTPDGITEAEWTFILKERKREEPNKKARAKREEKEAAEREQRDAEWKWLASGHAGGACGSGGSAEGTA